MKPPIWHGTFDEYQELLKALEKTTPQERWSMLRDQRVIDGLVFVRRRAEQFLQAEHHVQ